MQCYEYVLKNYRPHDKILMQKVSTDDMSTQGHFSILREGMIYEWIPGEGERILPYHDYWQIYGERKMTGAHNFFKIISMKEFIRKIHESGAVI